MDRRLVVAATAVFLAAPACGTKGLTSSGSANAPRPEATQSTKPMAGGGMADLATQVERLARAEYPESYAGLEVEAGGLVVYRKPSEQLDAALRTLPGGQRLVLRDAAHAARELDRLRDQVTADGEYWQRHGIVISSVASKHDGSAVEVATVQLQQAERLFPQRYGAGPPLELVRGGPLTAAS